MKKQPKIIIIRVESSKQAGIDDRYINTIIKYYYGDRHPIRYVNMDGKGNYKKRLVKKNIEELSIGFSEAIVIYAIDLDNFELNSTQATLNQSIKTYCNEEGYKLIWFYPNIEYVLFNIDIKKTQKQRMVAQFVRNQNIELIDSSYLEATSIIKGYSNILTILDDYMKRIR